MTINGLHHITMATPNIDVMRTFYRDCIGCTVVLDNEWKPGLEVADRLTQLRGSAAKHVMLKKGNAYIELFQFVEPEPTAGDSKRRLCDAGFTHFCLDVTDLDTEYQRLKSLGVTFHCPPQDVGHGTRTTYGRDPDGNVIEFQELPAKSLFAIPSPDG